MMKKLLIVALGAAILTMGGLCSASEMYVDSVTGLIPPDGLPVDQDVVFHLRYVYDGGLPGNVSGSANGFRLHSADASWTSFSGAIVSTSWSSAFTTGTYINLNPSAETPHLSGADTIGFAGLTLMGGVASGFNAITFTITTHFPASETGKKVALDTSWYPPAGEWLWTTDGWQGLVPGWGGGPYSSLYNAGGLQGYVFTIAGSGPCCVGIRGNVNGDALEDINISDITYLVAYAFKHGPAPPCPEEADCDGDLSLNVSDVTYLVKYAFKSGPAPVACP